MTQARQDLILLPGSLCDERVWANQARDLADIADIRIANFHGHDSLVGMARAALANAPERFALAGFSMGGRVALEILRVAPERITRLALVDASVHPIAAGEAERRQPQIDMARDQGLAALARWWNPRIIHSSRRGDAAYLDLLEAMACTFTAADYQQEVAALLNRPDPQDLLAGISVPTLVLAGAEDPLSTPERNLAIARAIPGARLLLIQESAHFPMLEKPSAVSAAMREWLQA